MSATITQFQPNPFETARAKLIEALQGLPVPRPISPAMPFPDDFETIAEHIRAGSRLFDTWLKAIGVEVRDNTWVRVSEPLFDGVYLDAVDGWATDCCHNAANAIREEYEAQGLAS
jgi:hypothetical protein